MKHSKQLLEQMQTYSAKIGLHPSLIDYPRTEDQAEKLLKVQGMVESHSKKLLEHMEQYSFSDAQREEQQAFKKLMEVMAYCEKFIETEAYTALKQLQEVRLPLATDSSRYKKQQMKTWIKKDLDRLLIGFENIENIKSSLLVLASN